jgi:hypothetical protein
MVRYRRFARQAERQISMNPTLTRLADLRYVREDGAVKKRWTVDKEVIDERFIQAKTSC